MHPGACAEGQPRLRCHYVEGAVRTPSAHCEGHAATPKTGRQSPAAHRRAQPSSIDGMADTVVKYSNVTVYRVCPEYRNPLVFARALGNRHDNQNLDNDRLDLASKLSLPEDGDDSTVGERKRGKTT
jgi:hypothetical protein